MPRDVVDICDADIEEAGGKRIGWETSFQLMRIRGSTRVLVKRLAKYEVTVRGETTVLATETPPALFPRALLHTSALAWLVVSKFAMGIPFHRLEQSLVGLDERLDRSTMCRNAEEVGNTLGATVVAAMKRDAINNCAVLSTDATGAAIQPEAGAKGVKQACKKGHFFTVVADADHVLYVYAERHTQDAVAKLFHGFGGYLQSDASSVYDTLERGPPKDQDDEARPTLVGCWAHARRYFFEAAICKYAVGVEGLARIRAIYAADKPLAGVPPSERQRRRLEVVAPLIDDFFRWVAELKAKTPGRTLATKALGYATNQEAELRRVLDDGRLPLDNNRSERALRKVVVGRKNWLFYGSDVHAEAAAALFSLIASCRLHRIEPEQYLDELMKVLPYWPKDRYLELSPRSWVATRARLDDGELRQPIPMVVVPPPVTLAGR